MLVKESLLAEAKQLSPIMLADLIETLVELLDSSEPDSDLEEDEDSEIDEDSEDSADEEDD